MDTIGQAAEQLRGLLDPMVALLVRQVRPVDDEISLRAAHEEFGRRWVDSHVKRGNITFRDKGKRRVLSRADLESLRAAEYFTPQLVMGRKVNSRGDITATAEIIESKKKNGLNR